MIRFIYLAGAISLMACRESTEYVEPPSSDSTETITEVAIESEEIDPSDTIKYCYQEHTNTLREMIFFDRFNDTIVGHGDGEHYSPNIHWSFDFEGVMVDSVKAKLNVTFENEGGTEYAKEEWLIYKDSMRILGDGRGTEGPYLLFSCN